MLKITEDSYLFYIYLKKYFVRGLQNTENGIE